MPTRRINLWRGQRALDGQPIEHHPVGVERFQAQRVASDVDFAAMIHAPKLSVRRIALHEWIQRRAAASAHHCMDAVHRSKTLKGMVVTAQNELHAILPRDWQEQALELKPVKRAVERIEAMRPAGVERAVEEKDLPRFARRGQIVGQPPVLKRIIIQVIIREQRVLHP